MRDYLIKKGNHYASGLHFGVHFGITEAKYKVRFSKECLYIPDWENDWNKLCGWSYGLHHHNSIRVCWRPQVVDGLDFNNQVTGKIELCIYVYEDSVRKTSQQTLIVDVERDITLNLFYEVASRNILLDLSEDKYALELAYTTKPSWGYRLYPYVGGTNYALQDTRIYLERL